MREEIQNFKAYAKTWSRVKAWSGVIEFWGFFSGFQSGFWSHFRSPLRSEDDRPFCDCPVI